MGIFLLFIRLSVGLGLQAQTLKRWLQPDSVPAMKPRFRTTDTTFLIGCYSQPEKLPSVDSLRRFTEQMKLPGGTIHFYLVNDDDSSHLLYRRIIQQPRLLQSWR